MIFLVAKTHVDNDDTKDEFSRHDGEASCNDYTHVRRLQVS